MFGPPRENHVIKSFYLAFYSVQNLGKAEKSITQHSYSTETSELDINNMLNGSNDTPKRFNNIRRMAIICRELNSGYNYCSLCVMYRCNIGRLKIIKLTFILQNKSKVE